MEPPYVPSPSRSCLRSVAPRAAATAAALVVAGGFVWLVITICRLVFTFIVTHQTAILVILLTTLFLGLGGVIVHTVAEHERKLLQQSIKDRARLESIDAMSGHDFEHFVADLLRASGLLHVRVIGRSGDRGVDITACTRAGRKIAVQCKRQAASIGADRIRNLIGAVHCTYTGHHPVLITSSGFTWPAADEGRGKVTMIGRARLVEWMNGKPLEL